MKEFYLVGILFSVYFLSVSVDRADGNNREAGVRMSVSVGNNDANNTAVNGSSTASGAHTNVGVWRPRHHSRPLGRNNGLGPRQPTYVARGSRRQPEYIRRLRQRLNNGRLNRHHSRRIGNSGLVATASGNNGQDPTQSGTNGLVATGSHSISGGNRRQGEPGLDPFVALQRGQNRGPFQDRQTAYDFLSNGGNSFRARNRQQRERRAENAQMASVMCGVFGKQFIPSAIGGRCVNPT